MKSFWKDEKIIFNIEIERRQLGDEYLFLYLLLIIQNNKAREHITSFKYIFYYRILFVAISSHDALITIK